MSKKSLVKIKYFRGFGVRSKNGSVTGKKQRERNGENIRRGEK